MLGVELDGDGERAAAHGFVTHRQRGGLLGRRADVGGGPGRGAAHGCVPRHMVLHRDLQRLGRVAEGVLAGDVVPGDQHDRHPELGDDMGVEQPLAGPYVVQPHARDLVREVGVGEDALHAGARVVADEGDAVDVAVLHALHHGERLVPAGEQLGPFVQPLQQQIAHGRVRLVDDHLVGAAVVEAEHGGVDVGGEQRAAALPLCGARHDVVRPGDPGGALHVGADEDSHDDPSRMEIFMVRHVTRCGQNRLRRHQRIGRSPRNEVSRSARSRWS